jgi:hypothetical protein
VSQLANKPKEFDKSWSELKAEIVEFDNVVEKLEEEYRTSHVGKGTATAGVAVGAGVAAFARLCTNWSDYRVSLPRSGLCFQAIPTLAGKPA